MMREHVDEAGEEKGAELAASAIRALPRSGTQPGEEEFLREILLFLLVVSARGEEADHRLPISRAQFIERATARRVAMQRGFCELCPVRRRKSHRPMKAESPDEWKPAARDSAQRNLALAFPPPLPSAP
jgi:hypothetical protein